MSVLDSLYMCVICVCVFVCIAQSICVCGMRRVCVCGVCVD